MKRLVVILTACLLLVGTLIGAASAEEAVAAEKTYPDLDYSLGRKPGSIYMGDVLEQLLGDSVTLEEKNAIRYKYEGQKVLYYARPAVVDQEFELDGETQTLTISLKENPIEDIVSGKSLCWIPLRVTVGESTGVFEPVEGEDGRYRAVVHDVPWMENVSMTIEYSSQVTVTADTLNDYINYAYDKALVLEQEYQDHQLVLEEYKVKLDEYNQNQAVWTRYYEQVDAYLDYQRQVALYEDLLLYQAYLAEMEVYNAEMAVYTANQTAWETYQINYRKWNEYLEYRDNKYDDLCDQHDEKMAVVNKQLALLELMEKPDPVTGHSFMQTMIDNRIGELIIEKKKEYGWLVTLLGSSVTKVETATPYLKEFCSTYLSLETDRERYEYYIKEYRNLVANLKTLYSGVTDLYEDDMVYTNLQKDNYSDRLDEMVRMMGSLYVYRCVFDDDVSKGTLNVNKVIDTRNNKTAAQLVDSSLRPARDDNDATPMTAWPVAPIAPSDMEVTAEPTPPSTRIPEPERPATPPYSVVSNPKVELEGVTQPAFMEEPVAPDTTIEHPGAEPALPWDATYRALHEAYKQGSITERAPFGSDQTFRLTVPVINTIHPGEDEHYYYVRFYNSDGTYLGYDAVRYGETAAYPDEYDIPTQAPVAEKAYEFESWVDEDGNPADFSSITENIDVFATYRVVRRKCVVTWDMGDRLIQDLWYYGETPTFTDTPGRSPTNQYVFTFVCWDREITAVTDDVTYTAQYSTTLNRHKVTFVMGDGSLIENEYYYGKDLRDAVPGQIPYKEPDVQYTYTFDAWVDDWGNRYKTAADFPTLECPVTYTAAFTETINPYTITWIVGDESIDAIFDYGQMPVFGDSPEAVPAIPPTETIEYVFTGWDRELTTVQGNATYTAQFEPQPRRYQIDFVVNEQVTTVMVEYGKTPEFEGTPTKPANIQYNYRFTGWDQELVPVTSDAVYTACFEQNLQKYPVKFIVGDQEIVCDVEYGKVPKYPHGTPSVPYTATRHYQFTGWDKTLVAVDGSEVVYTANFKELALVPGIDGEDGELTVGEDGSFQVSLQGSATDLSALFQKAGEAQTDLMQVFFGNAALVFPKAQIDAIYNMGGGIAEVRMSSVTYEQHAAYQIELLDENGNDVQFLVTDLTVKLPFNGVYSADVYHIEDDGSKTKMDVHLEDGYLVFDTMDFSTFMIVEKFAIINSATENGTLQLPAEAYDGDTVTITPQPAEGYRVKSIVIEQGGRTTEIEAVNGVYSFVMPKDNVTVTAVFKVVEGGTVVEVMVGVITAVLIVAIGIVITVIVRRKKHAKI